MLQNNMALHDLVLNTFIYESYIKKTRGYVFIQQVYCFRFISCYLCIMDVCCLFMRINIPYRNSTCGINGDLHQLTAINYCHYLSNVTDQLLNSVIVYIV